MADFLFYTRLLYNMYKNQLHRSVSQKSICFTPGVLICVCLSVVISFFLSSHLFLSSCYLNFFDFIHVSACLRFLSWVNVDTMLKLSVTVVFVIAVAAACLLMLVQLMLFQYKLSPLAKYILY